MKKFIAYTSLLAVLMAVVNQATREVSWCLAGNGILKTWDGVSSRWILYFGKSDSDLLM
jgi:hypothetical protein